MTDAVEGTEIDALIYTSDANTEFSEKALTALARAAAEANTQHGISGFLYFDTGRFVQFVEGPRPALDQLVHNLEADERHTLTRVVRDPNVEERRFPNWAMYQVQLDNLIELRMDHLLIQQLRASPARQGRTWEKAVWRMVDRLALLHTRYRHVT